MVGSSNKSVPESWPLVKSSSLLEAEIGALRLDMTQWSYLQIIYRSFGSVSKPCTPGEHQNSW